MVSLHRGPLLLVAVVLAAGMVTTASGHDGIHEGDHHGTEQAPVPSEHCVICPAVCLAGLGAAFAGVVLARRRRQFGRLSHLIAQLPSLLWASRLERPPELGVAH